MEREKKERDKRRYEEMKQAMRGGEFSAEEPGTLERAPADAPETARGKRVAVLVADGFEQAEFDGPVAALRQAGAVVEVLAMDNRQVAHIRGFEHFEPAAGTPGDRVIGNAAPDAYDMLLVPGGLHSPDTMRQSETHLRWVRAFIEADKPVAMICHGPWLLADAGLARGRHLTSWPGIRRDMERAGACWEDCEVVVDGRLVTSRRPDDVPAFSEAVLKLLAGVRR